MRYNVTQADLDILQQGEQEIFLKVELLNSNYKVLDSLEGNIISDSYSVDSTSIQRRNYQATLLVDSPMFFVGNDKKIWPDKKIRVYYGVYSLKEKRIFYYLLGIFAYNSLNYNFSPNSKTLSITCPDLMSLYDGTLNGELSTAPNTDPTVTAHTLTIPAGQDMRSSIIATLKDAGITRYNVEEMDKEIPYDLEFDTGTTYVQVWTTICNLYDSYEFFFDQEGVFIWRKVPTCLEDPIVLSNDMMQQIKVGSESIQIDFSNIYNVTEVWGKVLELTLDDRYADTSTYTNNIYNITLSGYNSWSDLDHLTQIGIKINTTNEANPQFSLNNFSAIPIYDGDQKPLKAGVLQAGNIYVFRYRRLSVSGENLVAGLFLQGQYQCHGIYKETSEKCPFSVTNLGYIVKHSVDYPNLSDDAACYNQAEYLTYTSTAMMDTINLTTLVIPWIDVNNKITYQPQNSDTVNQYIIKSFNWATGDGTMSLVLYRFQEDFSFVWKDRN